MGALVEHRRWTEGDFLAYEQASPERHEFLRGEVYIMAGVTAGHSTIQSNLLGEFFIHLRGKPCRAHGSDLMVRIEEIDEAHLFYPDVSVLCGPRDRLDRWADDPRLIVEILSESTELHDRRTKVPLYRTLPSVQEIVLVA